MFFTISISVHFLRLCNILRWSFLPNLIIFKVIGSKFYKQQCYIIRLIISQGCFGGGQEEGFKMVMMELMKDFTSLLLYLKSAKKKKKSCISVATTAHVAMSKIFFFNKHFSIQVSYAVSMQHAGHLKTWVAPSTEVTAIIAGLFKDPLQQGWKNKQGTSS